MNPVHDRPNTFVDIAADPSGAYNTARSVFAVAGLDLCQPVGGCSEVITNRIAEHANHVSCPFGYDDGSSCGECFKCFRKQQLLGRKIDEPLHPRIVRELAAEHLAMAASVIEGCHRVGHFPAQLSRYEFEDTSWTNRHYDASLDLLCPPDIADHVRRRLADYHVGRMTSEDIRSMRVFVS